MLARPDRACLAIADIAGYTSYLAGVELDHAQDVLADLINTVLGRLRPSFRLNQLEGDAAFVYALADSIDGSMLMDTIESCYFAFRRRLQSIRQASVCECNACILIPNLDLKLVVHHGTMGRQRIGGREQLVGPDVILVHRLLKNRVEADTGLRAYGLFSQACIDATALDPVALGMKPHRETYEHIGDVEGWVYDLAAAWSRESERRRTYIAERDAGVSFTSDPIEVPADLAWELMTSPVHRPRWQVGVDRVDVESASGRRGLGARNHCMHGKEAFVEDILDWRPPRYVTMRTSMPGFPPFLWMQEIESVEGGIRIHVRAKPTRDAKSRAAFDDFRGMLDQMVPANQERFRAVAEAEQAARRAAAEVAPEPELPGHDVTLRERTAIHGPSAPLPVE